jgi:hypothetical protein
MTITSRRSFFSLTAAASVAAVGLSPGTRVLAGEKEEDVALEKLPAVVRKAADKEIAKAKWLAATKLLEEGDVMYELDGKDAKGREVTVQVTADGQVVEVETEITMKEIPKVVTEALKKKLPGFKASLIHSVNEDGKIVSYSFEGKRSKDKQEVDVTVEADGTSVEVDDD